VFKALVAAVVLVLLVAGLAGAVSRPLAVSTAIATGKHPAAVVVASGSLWVTNDIENTITRIDPKTGKTTGKIVLHGKGYPDPSVVVAADGALWTVAHTTGTISRVDLKTGALTATTAVPGLALAIAVADGSVWVPSFDPYRCSNNNCFSRLTRLDARSARVTGKYTVDSPTGIAAGFGSLWIVDHRSATVTRFDPRTTRAVRVIPVRIGHEAITEGPEQVEAGLGAIWVSHPGQDVVTRIDPGTNDVAARVHLPHGATPETLAVGAGSIWAVGPKQIFRIDPKTNAVVQSARIGKHPGSDYRGLRNLVVDGNTLWVTDGDADTVDRIDLGPR
jgi:streptogramin lyase